MAKTITDKVVIDYFLKLEEKDITKSFIIENFGYLNDTRKYDPMDYITIPANHYGKNKKNSKPCKTTLGLWVFNKFFIEDLSDIFGYINETINQDKYMEMNQLLSYAIIEEKVTIEQLLRYLNKFEFFMSFVFVLSSNYDDALFRVCQKLRPYKKQLEKKYEKELAEGDFKVAAQMEKELMDKAMEYLGKDNESLEQFQSGAKGSMGNNFKNMFLMKGGIKNIDPIKGFDIGKSSYMDGISKEEYVMFGNSLVAGVYAKAKNTANGGYMVKLFMRAFQHVVQSKTKDCNTKYFIEVDLTSKNVSKWMYGYIIEGSKLIELTMDTMNKYIGKKVKMRYSTMCKAKDGICPICSSNLFKRMDIDKIGMTTIVVPGAIVGGNMKKFHDSTVKVHEIDITKIW